MKLFKRKNPKISDEAIAGKIAGGIIHYQNYIAAYLNKKTISWNPKICLRIMIGFCLFVGLYFLYVFVNALQNL